LPKNQFEKVFIFLDTDKHASAFDILTTIDLLPKISVLKYENVTAEDAEKIVRDAMFPRGPEGAKHTKIFINGQDFEQAKKILARVQKSMFPPFELAVIIDPRGAYTTASAAVAKTFELLSRRNLGSLDGKTVSVLAGTGPVGQTAALLYASEKAKVTVTSRSFQKASAQAAMVNEEVKANRVKGVEAKTPEEVGKAIEGSEVILSTGAAGTQLLPLTVLKEFGRKCRVVVDINAIPPLGVEGLGADADGEQIASSIFGVGALVVGKLKNKVEAELILRAAEESKGIFDYRTAYGIAKKLVLEKSREKRPSKPETPKHWLP